MVFPKTQGFYIWTSAKGRRYIEAELRSRASKSSLSPFLKKVPVTFFILRTLLNTCFSKDAAVFLLPLPLSVLLFPLLH